MYEVSSTFNYLCILTCIFLATPSTHKERMNKAEIMSNNPVSEKFPRFDEIEKRGKTIVGT